MVIVSTTSSRHCGVVIESSQYTRGRVSVITTYEQRLNRDLNWALDEGSMHFDETNAVHRALRRITARLTELGIPHAVVGGMAMFFHGFRRFTEDVDILVTRAGLEELHRKLEGLGYVPSFQGSKQLRDA